MCPIAIHGCGITGGTCGKFMNQHYLVFEPAFGLVQKKTTRATSICKGASSLDLTEKKFREEMPPPHTSTRFLQEKKGDCKPHRKPRKQAIPIQTPTWTTPQEVSGLTIELLHREKIVKKKHVLANSDELFFFDSHCSCDDSCAALLMFCPLVAAYLFLFWGRWQHLC